MCWIEQVQHTMQVFLDPLLFSSSHYPKTIFLMTLLKIAKLSSNSILWMSDYMYCALILTSFVFWVIFGSVVVLLTWRDLPVSSLTYTVPVNETVCMVYCSFLHCVSTIFPPSLPHLLHYWEFYNISSSHYINGYILFSCHVSMLLINSEHTHKPHPQPTSMILLSTRPYGLQLLPSSCHSHWTCIIIIIIIIINYYNGMFQFQNVPLLSLTVLGCFLEAINNLSTSKIPTGK